MVRAILKTLGLFRLRWTYWLLNVADTSARLGCSISEPSVRVKSIRSLMGMLHISADDDAAKAVVRANTEKGAGRR